MEYMIIKEVTISNLENSINNLLKDNWTVVGGITVVNDKRGGLYFLQAVIKE